MCRVMGYVGDPVLVDDLLFGAERALARQALDPRLMSLLNLGGFGFVAWDGVSREPGRPFTYRVPHLPTYDRNLKALAEKVWTTAMIAHVRGVVYDPGEVVAGQNVHPFRFPGCEVALAQNGDLHDFGRMRYDLLEHIRPDLARRIEGTTDTEWLYALVLSQLEDPCGSAGTEELAAAVERALELVRDVRERRGIAIQSPVNLMVSDGRSLVATRFVFDYGWYPEDGSFFAGEREFDFTTLWFTARPSSVLMASEPLTADCSAWFEVPEYSLVAVGPDGDGLGLESRELAL